MWCVHGLLLSYRFCSCATVLVVVMVLVCGCSCSVSKARVPVPLTALPVVFFCAGNGKHKPPLFPLALMRSLALLWHGIVPPGIRPLCIAPRKDNLVPRPCALTASSHGCRSGWTPHLTASHSALQALIDAV